jgi:glutathione peroxidase
VSGEAKRSRAAAATSRTMHGLSSPASVPTFLAMTSLHDFSVQTIGGELKPLSDYAGKVVLVVNVASRCGLTPQYAELEKLYRERKDDGFVVLGFPCNQFGGQEPGSEAQIQTFCSTTYDVTFPLFAKLDVNGAKRAPVYAFLATADAKPEGAGRVKWNFGKFLVGKDGQVRARFSPQTTPTDGALLDAIEDALSA